MTLIQSFISQPHQPYRVVGKVIAREKPCTPPELFRGKWYKNVKNILVGLLDGVRWRMLAKHNILARDNNTPNGRFGTKISQTDCLKTGS